MLNNSFTLKLPIYRYTAQLGILIHNEYLEIGHFTLIWINKLLLY